MKFTFNIIETSVLTHTVEAENLMEAEKKITAHRGSPCKV